MMSFLSSSTRTNEGESSRGGGVRSFLNSIVENKDTKADNFIHPPYNHRLNPYDDEEEEEEEEEDHEGDIEDEIPPSIHFSGEEEEEEEEDDGGGGGGEETLGHSNKDFCFFDSLTQKWVNFEDFSEVPSLYEESGGNPSLRMWDESLSKIEEVTECSSGRAPTTATTGVDSSSSKQRLILPLNSSNTNNSNHSSSNIINNSRNSTHRPIIVSTPSSSVSSSPFDKSATPPSLRRQISSNSSGNEPTALHHFYPRLNRTLPSSRRSSVDESVESFPINYSKSSYNSNVVGLGSNKQSPFGSGKISRNNRPAGGSYNNSPALERRRKKSVIPPVSSTPLSQRQNRSQSISNFSRTGSSNLNKSKSYSSGNISVKSDYSHVQSKVKAYIKSIKDLPKKPEEFSSLSAGKKSLSMSNLSSSRYFPSSSGVNGNYPHNASSSNIAASNLKSFLSYANLDEMTITVNKYNAKSADNLSSKSKFDTSRISRLLDNISDEEAMDEIIDSAAEDDEVVIDVEGILTLAFNERRDKQEAKKVLSQLQTNYDKLQRKYAEAENTIDKLRFGSAVNSNVIGASSSTASPFASSTPLPKDFLNISNNSILTGGPHLLQSGSVLNNNNNNNNGAGGGSNNITRSNSSLKLNNSHGGGMQTPPSPAVKEPAIAAPAATHRTPHVKEKYEATKKALVDIQDQLYGLEILSDSLDPKEKESAMEDRGRGGSATDGSSSDSEMVELLKQIGKKLYVKSPKVAIPNEKSKEFLDPFEKVSNWKTGSAHGSASGSPTPRIESKASTSKIADILLRQQNNDFDSGCCPGSERSVRSKDSHYRQKLNPPPEGMTRILPYNNYFKKKSHPSSSLIESSSTTTSIQEEEDDDEIQSTTSKRQIKRVDTDLSSSEPEEDEGATTSNNSQPKVLVQQINQDINELRSLFEDHREEMMWLVSQEKQKEENTFRSGPSRQSSSGVVPGDIFVVDDGQLRPPSASSSRRSLSSLHFAAVSSSSPPVSPGGTRRPLGSGVLKSPLHSRYHSQSQSLRRCGHIGQVRKKFDSEDTAEDMSMDDREIRRREFERRRKSKMTKRRSRESLTGDSEFVEDGRELSAGEGERRIFIPKLKIEDLWTDRTGDEDNMEDEKGGFSSSSASSSHHYHNHAVASKDGKKKPNREIKELLRSLEHANKMATKLKERSEEMLTVLKSEMASSTSSPGSNLTSSNNNNMPEAASSVLL